MKDQESGVFNKFKKSIQKNENALLLYVLSEIRKNAFLVSPYETSPAMNNFSAVEKVLISERELLLNQIEDAIEFLRTPNLSHSPIRTINLTQLVSDFAESYLRHHGSDHSSEVTFFIDHRLSEVKAYPDKLIKLVNCLVRAANRAHTQDNVKLIVRESGLTMNSDKVCQLVMTCKEIPFAVSLDQLQDLFKEFQAGIYLKCVRDLGLEMCCAMQIVREIGGTILPISMGTAGAEIEIRLSFEKVVENNAPSKIPNAFYLYSKSESVKKSFSMIAAFHRVRLEFLKDLTELPDNQQVVVDVLNFNEKTFKELNQVKDPSRVTLLTQDGNLYRIRQLARSGYSHFINMPLVSNKVMRAISGLDAYETQKNSSELEINRKLRVLVVDDAPTSRIVLKDFFESEGHYVKEASDGAEFVLRIQRGEVFDIIFCDLTMLHIDGPTAVKMVRSYEKNIGKSTPIVLMTAYSEVDKSVRDGFDRVLSKPLDLKVVSNILKELFYTREDSDLMFLNQIDNNEMKQESKKVVTEIINLGDLRERCAGKSKTMIRVLESFISTSTEQLNRLKSIELSKDNQQAAKILHTIKGLLLDVGAKESSAYLNKIEDNLKDETYNLNQDFEKIITIVTRAQGNAMSAKAEL